MNNKALLILALAFATRMIFALAYQGPLYYGGISGGYLTLADNVLGGKGFVVKVDVAPLSSGNPQWEYVPSIDRPLGYLLIILVPYWLLSSMGIQIFQAILCAVAALLLYRIASAMVSATQAFISALVYALWPLSARFEVTILPDAIMSLFLILSLWLIVRAGQSKRPEILWALCGIIIGIGALVRPDVILLPLFLIGTMFISNGKKHLVLHSATLLIGMAIAIMPSAIRNYEVTEGKFVPVGLGNGISLWEGISQFGDTLGTTYGDKRLEQIEGYRTWAYPDGIERDKRRFKEALSIIVDHPVWYAGIMLRRIPVLLRPDGIIADRLMPAPKEYFRKTPGSSVFQYLIKHPAGSLLQLFLVLSQWVALLLASISAYERRGNPLFLYSAVIVLYYVFIHIGTNAEPRYFYPALPFVLLLAVDGWNELIKKAKKA